MKTIEKLTEVIINGLEFRVSYDIYKEPATDINPPYNYVEIKSISYKNIDITDIINALDVEDKIIPYLP